MRPIGLSALLRFSRAGSVLLGSLAVASAFVSFAGCGGGGGGGSDPEVGAQALYVVDIDLDGRDGVSLNVPMTIEFSEFVLPSTIRHDTIQVRLGPRYGIQSFGDFKVAGNIVTFFPQLPTEADLSDSGFQPQSTYRVTVVGSPKVNQVKSYTGRPLVRSYVGSFATAAATSPDLFTTDTYRDDPPPAVSFSNPVEQIPWSAPYVAGGAKDVPTDAQIVLVLNKVPLLPSTITTNNVSLRMINRLGVPQNRPIQGTPTLEQSFDGVRLTFIPTFPLADQATYVLRIENRVTDLTGNYDLRDNDGNGTGKPNRVDLRSRAESGLEPDLMAFALANPDEIDPRTFLIFTTRDEPQKDLTTYLNFDGTDLDENGEEGFDTNLSTASFNDAVPGAVAGVFTAAGGTGTLGDFIPTSNTTLNTNSPTAVSGIFNFRQITINGNITVTITGTLPATLLSLKNVVIAGTLGSTGGKGDNAEANYQTSSIPLAKGGAGTGGGGKGGDCYTGTSWSGIAGGAGARGVHGGGGGGLGGVEPGSTVYGFGGGGGGGGHQYNGSTGSPGNYPSYASWNGAGGVGGPAAGIQPSSAATNDGKNWYISGVGGGGGGSGGNSHYYPTSTNWRNGAAGGGGGGGGILVKCANNITVTGNIVAKGGDGGSVNPGYYYYGAAGGGGAGGAIALYANNALTVTGGYLDTSGGAGGTPYTYGWGGAGGKGGGGYVQLEDKDGTIPGAYPTQTATILPDFNHDTFDPTGTAADAPSLYTSTWFNFGVFDPILQPANNGDFTDQNFPGCTLKYEVQMSREDPTNFGHADTSSINVGTGFSSDTTKASQWVVLKDPTLGVQDVTGTLNGNGYQFFRVRITFTLKDGQKRDDPVPYVDRLRFRTKY